MAAGGGVGKSFLLLALAREVTGFDGTWARAPHLFGSALAGHGVAIYVTAEDDAIEDHNRLHALGPVPERLYVVPLPDAGGTSPLYAPDPATRGPGSTSAWSKLEEQLKGMTELHLVILDPLQPLCALDLNVPENAQFVCSRLAALAAGTGASVIVSHHFAKREAATPEQAREAIRGTGGLVDGVRAVYALWNPKEDPAKALCQALGETFERGRVVMGGGGQGQPAREHLPCAMRGACWWTAAKMWHGLAPRAWSRCNDLMQAIAWAAATGKPYTRTGGNGVYERRHELPEMFHGVGKHRLSAWVDGLMEQG